VGTRESTLHRAPRSDDLWVVIQGPDKPNYPKLAHPVTTVEKSRESSASMFGLKQGNAFIHPALDLVM